MVTPVSAEARALGALICCKPEHRLTRLVMTPRKTRGCGNDMRDTQADTSEV